MALTTYVNAEQVRSLAALGGPAAGGADDRHWFVRGVRHRRRQVQLPADRGLLRQRGVRLLRQLRRPQPLRPHEEDGQDRQPGHQQRHERRELHRRRRQLPPPAGGGGRQGDGHGQRRRQPGWRHQRQRHQQQRGQQQQQQQHQRRLVLVHGQDAAAAERG